MDHPGEIHHARHRLQLGRHLAACEMVGDGTPRACHALVQPFLREGACPGHLPPMIEHRGDVADALGRGGIGHPQRQIVILAALIAQPQPPQVDQQAAAVAAEMADHIVAEHEIGVPVGLEIGAEAAAILVDEVRIGVDQIRIRMRLKLGRHLIERVLVQQIIMVEQAGEFAGGQFKRRIGGGRDMAILLPEGHPDARLGRCRSPQDVADLAVGRGVIGEAQFPIWPGLRGDRGDHLAQMRGVGVVDRHQHGEQRLALHGHHMGLDRLAAGCAFTVVGGEARLVIMGIGPAFPMADQQVMHQRVDARLGHIGIGGEIKMAGEFRPRVAVFKATMPEVVQSRIHPSLGHIPVAAQIPIGIEQCR